MAWKTNNTGTKHNDTCTMAFGRPSDHSDCPRCEELKNGAKARTWSNTQAKQVAGLSAYCFSVSIVHAHCTKDNNPSCGCGKMSYTD